MEEIKFETISGSKKYDSILLKTENGNYRTAIETAKAVCMGSRIVLFKKDDNKLILFNPSDIINEPVIGPTKWNPDGGDKAKDDKFTKEQFANFKIKVIGKKNEDSTFL